METLKTAVKIIKKILFAAECCILAHILVFWICLILSEIYSRAANGSRLLSAILFHSDDIVITIFFIEVAVFINYITFRAFGDIFEIDKKTMYYGIGFISTSLISVLLLHGTNQYYGIPLIDVPNSVICVPAIALFYYAYAGMGKKRRGTDRQNEKPISQVKGSCNPDEILPGQNTKEDNRKKKRDLAVKATGIFLIAASFFELMTNLLPPAGVLTEVSGSGSANYYFPVMSIMLLIFTIAVAHWKYSGYVFLTPRMLGWIAYFLSFFAIIFFFLHIPFPM